MKILVVGAGFAGACYARTLAEAGCAVTVIDKRGHVAGNAYDEMDGGVRVHRYGPHLFHTNNQAVVDWVLRFGEWVDYRHKVRARLPDGRLTPLPVNLQTLSDVFGETIEDEAAARALLAQKAVSIAAPANAEEYLLSTIGPELTELFFSRYTLKMWGLPLSALDKSIVQRLPLRFDRTDEYFPNDRFQMLPRHGYTRLFETILDHPLISLRLGEAFEHGMRADHAHVFNSMPIDEYYGFRFGELPYRSIRFHHARVADDAADFPVVNYTDSGRFTRRTVWSALPCHGAESGPEVLVTHEEPCDFADNRHERYYPVKTVDDAVPARLRQYQALAAEDEGITFIGRCGTYQYLDMHQVINQSIMGATKWLSRLRAPASP